MQLTQALQTVDEHDTQARADLIEAAYGEVRKLAACRMAGSRGDHTLTPTALAHEASLKMLGDKQLPTDSRGKFFAYVATVMRNLLIDYARLRGRQKRGGNLRKQAFDDRLFTGDTQHDDLAALQEALTRLAEIAPRQARAVELRFYNGMSNREVAQELGIALSTVKRDWAEARAWLVAELRVDE